MHRPLQGARYDVSDADFGKKSGGLLGLGDARLGQGNIALTHQAVVLVPGRDAVTNEENAGSQENWTLSTVSRRVKAPSPPVRGRIRAALGGKEDRRNPRYRVHLSVKFVRAKEFVVEYAENLSRGGLFVKGAHGLELLQEVDVEVELPGYGSFNVKAEVAHLINGDQAVEFGRSAGAGLAIKKAPDGFEQALSSYLLRLGRRADAMVMVADETNGLLLAAAGYQVRAVPEPGELVAAIARAPVPVVAVVVPQTSVTEYEHAAAIAGAGDIVISMNSMDEFEAILVRLDNEL